MTGLPPIVRWVLGRHAPCIAVQDRFSVAAKLVSCKRAVANITQASPAAFHTESGPCSRVHQLHMCCWM